MKCDMCDNVAAVFLTQIIDGKMTQVNLCDKCSKEKGVTDPTGFQLADFLISTAAQKKSKTTPEVDDDSLACPECGFTRAHLKKIGRMGCPQCYHTFADDLDNMLRAMHKGTRHVGKTPGRTLTSEELARKPAPIATLTAPPAPSAISQKKRLSDLKEAIEKAIEEERYEDAAKLRDEVKAMEEKVV